MATATATQKTQLIEVRRSLFNRILKLSALVEEVEKRQELDEKILDDPIVEMHIDIPPQLLKYATVEARN